MMVATIVFGVIAIVFVLIYNSLVRKRNQIDNASGMIAAYLKKRSDLIPNLVATVQQYTKHEDKVLTELTRLRSKVEEASGNVEEMANADSAVSGLLGQISVVVENYPDLKANENYMSLQAEMSTLEDQLSAARRNYNAVVVSYNDSVKQIPTNIVAGIMNYDVKPVFKVSQAEAQNPDVASLFKNAA